MTTNAEALAVQRLQNYSLVRHVLPGETVYIFKTKEGKVCSAIGAGTEEGHLRTHNLFTTHSVDCSDNFDKFPHVGMCVENMSFGVCKMLVETKGMEDYVAYPEQRATILHENVFALQNTVAKLTKTLRTMSDLDPEYPKKHSGLIRAQEDLERLERETATVSPVDFVAKHILGDFAEGKCKPEDKILEQAKKRTDPSKNLPEVVAEWVITKHESDVRRAVVAEQLNEIDPRDSKRLLEFYCNYKRTMLCSAACRVPPAAAKLGFGQAANFFFLRYGWEAMELRTWATYLVRRYFLTRSPGALYLFYLSNVFGSSSEFSKDDDFWAHKPPNIGDKAFKDDNTKSALQGLSETVDIESDWAAFSGLVDGDKRLLGKVNGYVADWIFDTVRGTVSFATDKGRDEAFKYLHHIGWIAWFDQHYAANGAGQVMHPLIDGETLSLLHGVRAEEVVPRLDALVAQAGIDRSPCGRYVSHPHTGISESPHHIRSEIEEMMTHPHFGGGE